MAKHLYIQNLKIAKKDYRMAKMYIIKPILIKKKAYIRPINSNTNTYST